MEDNRSRGQSLVELAISLMFLILLLAGTVDVGRALFTQVTLLDAAEEGAMYGSFMPGDTSGIEARIRDYANGPVDFADAYDVQVSIELPTGSCAGNLLRVTLSHNMLITTPFLGTVLGSQTIPISATAESLILAPGCP